MVFVILFFAIHSAELLAMDFKKTMENCKLDPTPEICVGLVLLDAIKESVAPAGLGSSKVYCRCISSGSGHMVDLIRVEPDKLPEVIAVGLNPDSCVQALNCHSCLEG